MKVKDLNVGDIAGSAANPDLPPIKVIGYNPNMESLHVICEDVYEVITEDHFIWNRDVTLISSGNDFTKEQDNLKLANRLRQPKAVNGAQTGQKEK